MQTQDTIDQLVLLNTRLCDALQLAALQLRLYSTDNASSQISIDSLRLVTEAKRFTPQHNHANESKTHS